MTEAFSWVQLVLWLGCILCEALCVQAMRKNSYSVRAALGFALLSLAAGWLIGHICYAFVRIDDTLHAAHPLVSLLFGNGSMLYGGMLGVVLSAMLTARMASSSAVKLLDLIAPFGALCIAFIRLSEGLSGANFGDYLEEGTFFARFPFAVYDAEYESWAEAVFMGGILAALALCVLLLKTKSRRPGDRALLMAGLYASAQVVLESMRFDDFLRWGFIRSSQLVSAALVAFVLACYDRWAKGANRAGRIGVWVDYAVCVALCLVLEFAVDGKIGFLTFLTPAACHGLMAIICAFMAFGVFRMRGFVRGKAQ